MRFMIRAVAATALAAALFGAASAAPFTTNFDDLRTYMETRRDAVLPNAPANELAQRAALVKGLAALNATSTSLDGDVRMFGKVAAAIESVQLPDAAPHLESVVVALHDAAVPARDALAARIATLISPKLLGPAQTNLANIDASLNSAATAVGEFSLRAIDLHSALTTIAATNARISKGTAPRGSPVRPGIGYFVCLLDGVLYAPTFGSGRVRLDLGQPSEITLTGYFPSVSKGGIEIQWSTGTFTGPGTYALDGTSGAFVVLTQNGQTFFSDGSGGQVTVTDYNPATKRIAGTFDASLVSNNNDLRTIQKGFFDVRRYATTGK